MTSLSSMTARNWSVDDIIGGSEWAHGVRAQIARVAAHDSTVLITGPTGTGKELIARAVHACSPRAARPLIPVDCTAISGTLFASQLFGHRKGAYTGAQYEALGCFRAADRGTIFLDEIGELDPDLQAKLLRVIQEKMVIPVGSHEGVPVDVRIICATNRDLKKEVVAGRFREDLYYRLAVVPLQSVALRERSEDIPILAEHFLLTLENEYGFPRKQISPGAMELLRNFEWPGNVRQLRHLLEQVVVACDGPIITLALLQKILHEATMPDGEMPPGPQDAWPPAANAYGAPQQYNAPPQYGPPQQFGAPQQYGAPPNSYNAPPQYGAPPQHGAPQHGAPPQHGQPQYAPGQFGTPNQPGTGQPGAGQYGAAQPGTGQFGTGQQVPGQSGTGVYGSAQYGGGQFGAGQHGSFGSAGLYSPYAPVPQEQWDTLEQLERKHILLTLEHVSYNQSAAARMLGITRQALLRKTRKYHLELPMPPVKKNVPRVNWQYPS